MKLNIALCLIAANLLAILPGYGQGNTSVKEYLGVPGPFTLNKIVYKLAWTSHPSGNYYKQEYVPAQDKLQQYKKMLMIELLIGDESAEQLANAKVEELKQLKLLNPMINYNIFKKNGEILLDFLITQNSPDGKQVEIIERNVYRYKVFNGNSKQGVMLFAASERAYGNDVDAFLVALQKNRSALLNAVAAFILPAISLKN